MITRTIRKLREDGKMVQANVTDAEVSDAYERNKATMPKREPSVTWRQIIVPPKPSAANKEIARQKAESLLAELKTGGDFEKLAKRESADPGSKDNGGDLGWNRRGKMVPEFDRWMFGLQPGQLSPVIETSYGYHIIRVDRVNPAEVKARHILIAPKIDSNDVARAKLEADSVRTAWLAGAPFDSLAKKHHDFKSGEETTLLTPFRARRCRHRIRKHSQERRRRTSSSSPSPAARTCRPSMSSRRSRPSKKAATSRSPR